MGTTKEQASCMQVWEDVKASFSIIPRIAYVADREALLPRPAPSC